MGPNERRRFRVGLPHVGVVIALTLAMSGGALAAGHYLITSIKQIKPKVVRQLRGARGPKGPPGNPGVSGQGPATEVYNPGEVSTSTQGDTSFHQVATLPITSVGAYVATAKVSTLLTGGSGMADTLCKLVAHTSTGGPDDTDSSTASLQNNSTVEIGWTTMSLELTHTFDAAGTITLLCQQNGTTNGGAFLHWTDAAIIATKVVSATSRSVSS